MYEESIYALIEKEDFRPRKEKRYRSYHDPKVAPTGSTFGLGTTSKPGVSNLVGDPTPPSSNHIGMSQSGTFGKPEGKLKPDTKNFTKRQTGTIKLTKRMNINFKINSHQV